MEKKIKVEIRKQIELMGICLKLSNYEEKIPRLKAELKGYPYYDDVKAHFGKFKDHKAIQTLNEIIDKLSFSYDAPFGLMIFVDNNYNFHGQDVYPFADRLQKSPLVLKFLDELKDFVKDTEFEKFFAEHKDFYESELENFSKTRNLDNVLPWMQKFFRNDFKDKNFYVILNLLSVKHGYARNDGQNFFCIESKRVERDGETVRKDWGTNNTSAPRSHYLHEFCHSIINPLTHRYYDGKKLKISKEEKERLYQYNNDETRINEIIIRAIQFCYMNDCGDTDLNDFYAWNEMQGFNREVLRSVFNRLVEYQNDKNSNFEDIYVDIIDTISEAYDRVDKEKNCKNKE